ncbi:MAG: peptidoglycan-associated lipoprotein Pal [Pseudomonadota bacterium]
MPNFTSHTNLKHLALLAASSFFLVACNSVKLDETKPVVEERKVENTTTPAKVDDTRKVETVDTKVDPLKDPNGVLAKRSVYFDYDMYTVKDEYKGVVQNHAKFLSGNKQYKILIQGNTDERGGSEYNLALGQKRADAVRKAMGALGVPESQMEAVSFGKEKPKATGSDEAAWAENRRADIVYP